MNDFHGQALIGTFIINCGSLIEQIMQIKTVDDQIQTFPVELDLDSPNGNNFYLKGNPWLENVSHPDNPEYYFHSTALPLAVDLDPTIELTIWQTRDPKTVQVAKGTSDSVALQSALEQELGLELTGQGEIGAEGGIAEFLKLTGKSTLGMSVKKTLKRSTSETTQKGESETTTETWTYKAPSRRLKIMQKGVPYVETPLDE
jgi:hypothetical protein